MFHNLRIHCTVYHKFSCNQLVHLLGTFTKCQKVSSDWGHRRPRFFPVIQIMNHEKSESLKGFFLRTQQSMYIRHILLTVKVYSYSVFHFSFLWFPLAIFIQCWPSLLHLIISPLPPNPIIFIKGLYLLYPTIYCVLRQYNIIHIICIPCLPYAIFYPFLTSSLINLGVGPKRPTFLYGFLKAL